MYKLSCVLCNRTYVRQSVSTWLPCLMMNHRPPWVSGGMKRRQQHHLHRSVSSPWYRWRPLALLTVFSPWVSPPQYFHPDWGWHGLYFPVQGQRGTIPPEGMKGSFKQGQSASFMAQSGWKQVRRGDSATLLPPPFPHGSVMGKSGRSRETCASDPQWVCLA